MIGRSPEMEKIYRILSKVAQSTHPVLILGESGTGKELVARTIHAFGPNCAEALPASRLRLAGAHADRKRAVRLREGRLHRGQLAPRTDCWSRPRAERSSSTRSASFRSNCRPSCCAPCRRKKCGRSAPRIAFPSRRASWPPPTAIWPRWSRRELFARTSSTGSTWSTCGCRRCATAARTFRCSRRTFLTASAASTARKFTLSDEALRTMMRHDWPGNVRELENALERACALCSGPVIHLGDLPTQLQQQRTRSPTHCMQSRAMGIGSDGAVRGKDACRDWSATAILRRNSRAQRRQAAGRAAARHRQDDALPQAEGVRHRRSAAGRVRTAFSS